VLRGGRFCNGQAPGGVRASDGYVYGNMDADDMDPIRRPCMAAVAGVTNATKCTIWPTGVACTAGQTNCTQGLVVALTDADPASADITVSIANRVAGAAFRELIGYAGREAVKQAGNPTAGPTINKNSFADNIVRLNQYLLSRRLYLNHGDPLPNPNNDPAIADQQAQEDMLYAFATDPDNGRCDMQPIMPRFGFINCLPNCNVGPSGYNLCYDVPFGSAESTSALLSATGPGIDCTGTSCVSTGGACPGPIAPATKGTCVQPALAASGEPCSQDSDCATGLTCQDQGLVVTVCGAAH
ncbi:MAG TPA: hypothetical protein VF518_10125, partial [Polyangia bacterium]